MIIINNIIKERFLEKNYKDRYKFSETHKFKNKYNLDEISYSCLEDGELDSIWYYNKDGLTHRENDLPAVINYYSGLFWYKYGLTHRDGDKPAIITESKQAWLINGHYHREGDNPAIVYNWGKFEFWKNGRKHRDDFDGKFPQPAVIYAHGRVEFWKDGIEIEVKHLW